MPSNPYMNRGPIIIVDDDPDDREFLKEAWSELGFSNPLLFFGYGEEVLNYLSTDATKPFLILCDINIPRMDGFELKERILGDHQLNYKSIPFVYWSTAASTAQIQNAYDLGGNGFFIKEDNLEGIKRSLVEIVQYWLKSKTPA